MPFTSSLGTVDSQLGNIQFAEVGEVPNDVSQLLVINQSVIGFNGNIRHTLALSQQVSVEIIYELQTTNTIVFNQVAEATRLALASNTIVFADDADVEVGKGAYSTLVVIQEAIHQYTPHFDNVSNVLSLVQSVVFSLSKTVTDTLTLSQEAVGEKIKFGIASNLFVMAQNPIVSNVQSLENTLTFAQAAIGVKVATKNISQSLVISQSASTANIYLRSLIDTLVFSNTFIKESNLGIDVPIPTVQVSKVASRVILETPERVIILPRPLLGDTEAGLGKLVIHRTTNGGTYTYARKQQRRKLKYSFNIRREKALEFRDYLLNYIASPMRLTNFKGEIWYGHIMNNPLELIAKSRAAPCSEMWETEVEFEGIRIH